MKYVLALDQGTTSSRAIVFDHDGRLVATIEHGGIKNLIAQLEGVEPEGAIYDAKVQVLSEYVEHHIKEEQNEMFPKVKASSLDLVELGARMATRKADLLGARS